MSSGGEPPLPIVGRENSPNEPDTAWRCPMSTELKSSTPAHDADSGSPDARPPRWRRYLGATIAGIATAFTILGVSIFTLVDGLGGGSEIYMADQNYSVRGVSEPTAESLAFKNEDSRDILLVYLKLRMSRDAEDREATASYFRQILKREDGISSAETESHLLTVHGETCLYHGNPAQAAEYFAQARALWPDNPWAAIRLYKATREQVRAFLDREPWSQEEQTELRALLRTMEDLEQELEDLETVRRIALFQLLDAGDEDAVVLAERDGGLGFDLISLGLIPGAAPAGPPAPVALDGPDCADEPDPESSAPAPVRTWQVNPAHDMSWQGMWTCVNDDTGTAIVAAKDTDDLDFFNGGEAFVWRPNPDDTGTPPASPRPGGVSKNTWKVSVISGSDVDANGVPGRPPKCGAHCTNGNSCDAAGCDSGAAGQRIAAWARILAVGIDHYPADPRFESLRFAASDAGRVAQAFAGLSFEPELLVNGAATRKQIVAALVREVLASRPGDELIFYFSGHGFTDRAGRRALVTSGPAGGEALALAEVEAFLSHHRGRVTIVVDSCLDRRDLELDFDIPDVLFGRNRPAVLVAGSPGEIAIESNELGAGVFSYTLVAYLERLAEMPCAGGCRAETDPEDLFLHTSAATQRLAEALHGIEQSPRLLVPQGP